ncbi:MAG: patatin-like phospholipase family protein [Candidatus Poribacteria bacterium]|nr:patatin-like phospholipase family protein [Candidatus Poribacteria bacterium]
MSERKTFNVLSIDGGGIRGIIPAMVLAYIECKTSKRICELFDLIAGTSTGGILALALTKPDPNLSDSDADPQPEYTAKRLVSLYRCRGRDIFDRSLFRRIPLMGSLGGLFDELYSSDGIEDVLEEYFGNVRLSEALTPVLIPSYDMQGTRRYWRTDPGDPFKPEPRRNQGGSPRFFKSDRAICSSYEDYLMRDVARATSAAPTYFEPHKVKFDTPDEILYETLVDGGIFANNPAMCAYAEAKRKIKDSGCKKEILLVSLGTGELTKELDYHEARDWGQLSWVQPLFRMIFDGANDTVNYQLKQLLGNGNEEAYYRFQTVLTEGKDAMDDVSRTNLTSLISIAKRLITRDSDRLNNLCEQLKSAEENS